MMRAVHGSTVLYPCDANQTARLVGLMAEQEGISYLRTTREKTPILYTDDLDGFRIGGSRVVRGGQPDDAVAVDRGRHHGPRGDQGRRRAEGDDQACA